MNKLTILSVSTVILSLAAFCSHGQQMATAQVANDAKCDMNDTNCSNKCTLYDQWGTNDVVFKQKRCYQYEVAVALSGCSGRVKKGGKLDDLKPTSYTVWDDFTTDCDATSLIELPITYTTGVAGGKILRKDSEDAYRKCTGDSGG